MGGSGVASDPHRVGTGSDLLTSPVVPVRQFLKAKVEAELPFLARIQRHAPEALEASRGLFELGTAQPYIALDGLGRAPPAGVFTVGVTLTMACRPPEFGARVCYSEEKICDGFATLGSGKPCVENRRKVDQLPIRS